MSYIIKGYCKNCGKYYEGRGKLYCSNACCKKDKEYQKKRSQKLLGRPTWNKGKHIKINDALKNWRDNGGKVWNKGLKGIHFSSLTEFKKGDIRISGKNNPNWKGGVSEKNKIERNSDEYNNWRIAVYKRDKYTCQHCGKHCNKKDIVAHHIYYFSYVPELRFSVDNGITLCRSCHFKLHIKNKEVDDIFYKVIKKPEYYNWTVKNFSYVVGQNI
jgi:hypothetical protein